MAQNEKAFIESLCAVFNALNKLGLEFKCKEDSNKVKTDTESDIKNNYIHVTVNPKKEIPEKFYITIRK